MHAEHADRMRLNELSGIIIGCAFTVLNTLGAGFLEKVYEIALALELSDAGSPLRSSVAPPSHTTVQWSVSISWTW